MAELGVDSRVYIQYGNPALIEGRDFRAHTGTIKAGPHMPGEVRIGQSYRPNSRVGWGVKPDHCDELIYVDEMFLVPFEDPDDSVHTERDEELTV